MKYDVFISCKSEDYNLARVVYNFLRTKGLSVFLADAELRRIRKDEYGKVIDAALESSEHFILLASRPDYVVSTYVEVEWRIFLEEKRSGRKKGNILTIRKGFNVAKLPIALRSLQSFEFVEHQSIIDYLPIDKHHGDESISSYHGMPRELKEVMIAAESGNPKAQYELGLCYFTGIDLTSTNSSSDSFIKDYALAVKWYSKSAEQNYIDAQIQLGICFAQGLGVEKNEDKAHEWWLKAAEQGDESAIKLLPHRLRSNLNEHSYELILGKIEHKKEMYDAIRIIRDVLETSLPGAKALVDGAPSILVKSSSKYNVLQIKHKIDEKIELPLYVNVNSLNKTYNVGDYYNDGVREGVVFKVSPDGKHGKIVNLKESEKLQWSSDRIPQVGANSHSSGVSNMQKIKLITDWQNKFPAFKWCADLGENWYLPSIEELEEFMLNDMVHNAVNHTLIVTGGQRLHSKGDAWPYWSSTENSNFYVWIVNMYGGTNYTFNNFSCHVRAISTF